MTSVTEGNLGQEIKGPFLRYVQVAIVLARPQALAFGKEVQTRIKYIQGSVNRTAEKERVMPAWRRQRETRDKLKILLHRAMCTSECLGALGNAGNVGAAAVGLATGDGNTRPSPASARGAAAACDNDIVSFAGDSTGTTDVLDSQAGNGDASAGGTVEIATVVVLLDQDAVATVC